MEEVSSLDEDELNSLLGSSDEEEIVLDIKSIGQLQTKMENFYQTFPLDPDEPQEKMVFWMYYAILYSVFYILKNDTLSEPDPSDSDADLEEKATGIHMSSLFEKFVCLTEQLSVSLYKTIENAVIERNVDHPILEFMEKINDHKELHSRRIKGDPTMQRTKMEIVKGNKPAYNIITDELFDPENIEHKDWKWLIINPLPSDEDYDAIDPAEGDDDHRVLIELQKLEKTYPCEEPYGVLVTNDWDKLLRLLHTLLHLEDYIQTYIVGAITSEEFDHIADMRWKDAWKYLAKEHADKPVGKLSREKKKMPLIISRMAEMRDLLKDALRIVKL